MFESFEPIRPRESAVATEAATLPLSPPQAAYERLLRNWWQTEFPALCADCWNFVLHPYRLLPDQEEAADWHKAQAQQQQAYVELQGNLVSVFNQVVAERALANLAEQTGHGHGEFSGELDRQLFAIVGNLEDLVKQAAGIHRQVQKVIGDWLRTEAELPEPHNYIITAFTETSLAACTERLVVEQERLQRRINDSMLYPLRPVRRDRAETLDLRQLVADHCYPAVAAMFPKDAVPVEVNPEAARYALVQTKALALSWLQQLFDDLLLNRVNLVECERFEGRAPNSRPEGQLLQLFLAEGLPQPQICFLGQGQVLLRHEFSAPVAAVPAPLGAELRRALADLNLVLTPQGIRVGHTGDFEAGLELFLSFPSADRIDHCDFVPPPDRHGRMPPPSPMVQTTWTRSSKFGTLPITVEFPAELLQAELRQAESGSSQLRRVLQSVEELLYCNQEINRAALLWHDPHGVGAGLSPVERMDVGAFLLRLEGVAQIPEYDTIRTFQRLFADPLPGSHRITAAPSVWQGLRPEQYPNLVLDGWRVLHEPEQRRLWQELLGLITPIGYLDLDSCCEHINAGVGRESFRRELLEKVVAAAGDMRHTRSARPRYFYLESDVASGQQFVKFCRKNGMPVAHLLVDGAAANSELVIQNVALLREFSRRIKEAQRRMVPDLKNIIEALKQQKITLPDEDVINIRNLLLGAEPAGPKTVRQYLSELLRSGEAMLRADGIGDWIRLDYL